MIKNIPWYFVFFTCVLSACHPTTDTSTPDWLIERLSPYDFEETLQNLDIAISEHNYRLMHRSHIGQAVRDRGEKSFPLATITSFCNITHAREMMHLNPRLISVGSCEVAVRESVEGVIVSTRLLTVLDPHNPDEHAFVARMNQELLQVIEATIQ